MTSTNRRATNDAKCATKSDKGFNTTDLGNAQRLIRRHGQNMRWCPQWNTWMVWDDTRWTHDHTNQAERNAKDAVRNINREAAAERNDERRVELQKWAKASEAGPKIREMISLAKSEPGTPVLPEEFDQDIMLFNCTNVTVDLRTGGPLAHDRAHLCTKRANVRYDPNADCPQFKRFLHEIMDGRQGLVDYLQRAFGYALTGDTSTHVLFVMHGHGRNGKSTLLGLMHHLLGDYACQTSFGAFTAERDPGGDKPREELASLVSVRCATAIETSKGVQLDEGTIKQATGGDPISCHKKHGHKFEYQPQFKLFLAVNHRPTIRDNSLAMWTRVHLIPFDRKFIGQDRNRKLPTLLRGELPGILNWAIEGCLQWQQNDLQPPEEVQEATAEYREEQDVLAGFLRDCCVLHRSVVVANKALYQVYEKWCGENGERPISKKALSANLKERGLGSDHKADNAGNVRWLGIGLKSDIEVTWNTESERSERSEAFPQNSLYTRDTNAKNPENGSDDSEPSEYAPVRGEV